MKLILRLLFGKPKKANMPKKKKKNLGLSLLDKLAGAALAAVSLKWNEDLWKPNSQ